jgi:hypothetical protein
MYRLPVPFTALAIILLSALIAAPSMACGDDEYMPPQWHGATKNVEVTARGTAFDAPEKTKLRATWLYRIQALVDDPNDMLTYDLGYVHACNGNGNGEDCQSAEGLTLAQAFRFFAKVNGASHAEIRAARGAKPPLYTIQLAASRNKTVADRVRNDTFDAIPYGALGLMAGIYDYDEPVTDPHILTRVAGSGEEVHEVVVGVYFAPDDAKKELAAIHKAYPNAFVRPL